MFTTESTKDSSTRLNYVYSVHMYVINHGQIKDKTHATVYACTCHVIHVNATEWHPGCRNNHGTAPGYSMYRHGPRTEEPARNINPKQMEFKRYSGDMNQECKRTVQG